MKAEKSLDSMTLSSTAGPPEAPVERHSSTLVAVTRALLMYVDVFTPQLRWVGTLASVDFVEALFPFVADIVQNGWYSPPAAAAGGTRSKAVTSPAPPPAAPFLLSPRAGGPGVHRKSPQRPISPPLGPLERAISPGGGSPGARCISPLGGMAHSHRPAAAGAGAAAAAVARTEEVASRALRNKIRMAQADANALWDLRHFSSTAKMTSIVTMRLGKEHMEAVGQALRSGSPTNTSPPRGSPPPRGVGSPTAAAAQQLPPRRAAGGGGVPLQSPRRAAENTSPRRGTNNNINSNSSPTRSSPPPLLSPPPPVVRPLLVTAASSPPVGGNAAAFSKTAKEVATLLQQQQHPDSASDSPRSINYDDDPGPAGVMEERNVLQDKQNLLVAELVRILKGPLGSRRAPFFPTPDALRAYVEFLLTMVYAAADERNTQKLSWTAFESFLSDGAIVYSTQLSLEDITIYIQEFCDDIGGLCIFVSALSNGSIALVVQTGTLLSFRYLVPLFNSSGNRMQFHMQQVSILYAVCAAEVIESKKVLCGCSRHSAVFHDVSGTNSLPIIQSFSLEMLGDTPCCARNVLVAGQETLIVTGVAGTIWCFKPPYWSASSHSWEMGCILWRKLPVAMAKEAISTIIVGYTPKLYFAATRGEVFLMQLPSTEVVHSLSTAADGIHHCRFLVYNTATRYLVAGGEASYLLVWLSPNLPDRRPVKLEDLVNPHSGQLGGVLTHPTDPVVISVDVHGLMKFWSLARLACMQNVRVPNSMNSLSGLMWLKNTRLVVATYSQLACYKVDDETKESPVATLVKNPKGGSITACIQRDVIEWGTMDGEKLVHHQNLCEADIASVAYGGSSVVFLLMSNGSVGCHSSSSGKQLAFYHRKIMRTEGVAMVFCPELRRAIIATVSSDVWFFSQTVSEPPFRVLLTGGDAACTCVTIGNFDKTSKYLVGTHENAVQIFSLKPPNAVLFEHRIPPPATDGSVGNVVALLFSNNCVFISDNLGWLRIHKGGKWQLIGAFDLEEMEASYIERTTQSPRDDSGSGGGGSFPASSSSSTAAKPRHLRGVAGKKGVGCTHITKMEHYVENAVMVLGDSIGRVWVVDVGTPSAPVVVKLFDTGGGPVKQLAVEGDFFFTADDSSNLFIWTSDGVLLGNLWGAQQKPVGRLPVLDRPSWYADCVRSIDHSTAKSMRAQGRLSATFLKSISRFMESTGRMASHARRSVVNKAEEFAASSQLGRSLSLAVAPGDNPEVRLEIQRPSLPSLLALPGATMAPPSPFYETALAVPPKGTKTASRFNRVSFCMGDAGGGQAPVAPSSPTPAAASASDGMLEIDSDGDDDDLDASSLRHAPLPSYAALPPIRSAGSLFFDDSGEASVATTALPIAWRASQQATERLPTRSPLVLGGASPGGAAAATAHERLCVVNLCWGYPSLKNRAALVDPPLLVSAPSDLAPVEALPSTWKAGPLKPVHMIRTTRGGSIVTGTSVEHVEKRSRSAMK